MQRDEFLRESLHQRSVGRRPARVDPDVATLRPPELLEPLAERPDAGLCFRVALGIGGQYADPSHPAGLLRARGERPRRAPCYQRYELASSHRHLYSKKGHRSGLNSFIGSGGRCPLWVAGSTGRRNTLIFWQRGSVGMKRWPRIRGPLSAQQRTFRPPISATAGLYEYIP